MPRDARITKQTRKGYTIDLRCCKRCGKIPRGKLAVSAAEHYSPFCSYHCQKWWELETVQEYINTLKEKQSHAVQP